MKIKIFFYLFVLIVFTISCKKEKHISSKELVSYEIVKKIGQYNPGYISFMGDYLVVQDWEQNPRIHFYDRENVEHLFSFGQIGEGPGEFSSPEFLLTSHFDGKLYVNDLGKAIVKVYEIDSLKNSNFNESLSFVLPAQLFVSDNLFVDIQEDKIYGENYDTGSDNDFFSYSIKDSTLIWYKNDEKFKQGLTGRVEKVHKKNMAKTFLSYDKPNNLIIASYLLYNRIDLMDFDFNVKQTIVFGDELKKPVSKIPFDMNNIIHYYGKPLILNNCFIIPYRGNYTVGNQWLTLNHKTYLQKYDFNGKLLAIYSIDKIINHISYDSKSNYYYAVIEDEEYSVIKFKM